MNTASRSENTARNIGVGAVRQVVTLLLAFAVRTVFVRRLGADYTGVNGLYSNILAMLSLAELGVGNVLVYSLEGGATVVVRPSGTEPKVKAYYTTKGKDLAEAQARKDALAQAMKPLLD